MSGGHFGTSIYAFYDIAEQIRHEIESNDDESLDDWGGKRGNFFSAETIKEFKKGQLILKRAQCYAHRIDYLLSGDDGEDSFHERLAEDLAAMEDAIDD